MAKKKSKARVKTRDQPTVGFLLSDDGYRILCPGYTRLSENPEVGMCVGLIADLISSMTLYLMENRDRGDARVFDGMSRKLDIEPYSLMTKKSWLQFIVHTMLTDGDGNAVVLPRYREGLLTDLEPLPAGEVSLVAAGSSYRVLHDGAYYEPDEVLHIVLKPDPDTPWKGIGPRVELKDVVNNLKQAGKTKKEFMTDKWRPSVVISVDGLTDEFEGDAGREKILNRYISETGSGSKPWVIPADLVKVDQVRPLSLSDLALNDAVEIDKRTVAGIYKVPPYFVGVGAFNQAEYNNFIQTTIFSIAQSIAQEFTRKLLLSPRRYFKFNSRSLLAYNIDVLKNVGADLYTRGIMTGNEVRGWIDLEPKDGLDELIILENYIPQGMIGDQKKLNGGSDDEKPGNNDSGTA